jgi:4-hydroxybenzoate polyprenyltransferase
VTPVAREVARAARPAQWVKNLLVFAGLVFADELGEPGAWAAAAGCFLAFCAASSAAYLLNDVRDAELDRAHPTKRDRPVARGTLSPRAALAAAGVLGALALVVAAALGVQVVVLLLAFVCGQVAYSLGLKHVVGLDVVAIAGLFVARAAAGAAAVDVDISTWLLACTALLALLLGLAKRRGELALADEREPGRPVLEGYSLAALDRALAVVAAVTLVAYALYTVLAGAPGMPLTIPFVAFGLLRYGRLVATHGRGEAPDRVLLEDRPLQLTIGAWVAFAALLVARDG